MPGATDNRQDVADNGGRVGVTGNESPNVKVVSMPESVPNGFKAIDEKRKGSAGHQEA